MIVVEQHHQLAQLQVPGQARRLVTDAFHQAAVTGDAIGIVIDDLLPEAGGEDALRQGEADRIGDPLTQRPGRGLDPAGVAELRMTGRLRAELAEVPQLVHRHVGIARQMQQRVEQHRPVARAQHEAVAIGPVRAAGIEVQELGEQHGRHIGHAHGHAGVTGVRLLDSIHRQGADGIGHGAVINFHDGPLDILDAGCVGRADVRHRLTKAGPCRGVVYCFPVAGANIRHAAHGFGSKSGRG